MVFGDDGPWSGKLTDAEVDSLMLNKGYNVASLMNYQNPSVPATLPRSMDEFDDVDKQVRDILRTINPTYKYRTGDKVDVIMDGWFFRMELYMAKKHFGYQSDGCFYERPPDTPGCEKIKCWTGVWAAHKHYREVLFLENLLRPHVETPVRLPTAPARGGRYKVFDDAYNLRPGETCWVVTIDGKARQIACNDMSLCMLTDRNQETFSYLKLLRIGRPDAPSTSKKETNVKPKRCRRRNISTEKFIKASITGCGMMPTIPEEAESETATVGPAASDDMDSVTGDDDDMEDTTANNETPAADGLEVDVAEGVENETPLPVENVELGDVGRTSQDETATPPDGVDMFATDDADNDAACIAGAETVQSEDKGAGVTECSDTQHGASPAKDGVKGNDVSAAHETTQAVSEGTDRDCVAALGGCASSADSTGDSRVKSPSRRVKVRRTNKAPTPIRQKSASVKKAILLLSKRLQSASVRSPLRATRSSQTEKEEKGTRGRRDVGTQAEGPSGGALEAASGVASGEGYWSSSMVGNMMAALRNDIKDAIIERDTTVQSLVAQLRDHPQTIHVDEEDGVGGDEGFGVGGDEGFGVGGDEGFGAGGDEEESPVYPPVPTLSYMEQKNPPSHSSTRHNAVANLASRFQVNYGRPQAEAIVSHPCSSTENCEHPESPDSVE